MPMPHALMVRTFRAALALRDMTQASWADHMGITEGHLNHLLGGRRDSKRLRAAIEDFIRTTFNEVLRAPSMKSNTNTRR